MADSLFDKLVKSVDKGMRAKKYDKTPALKEETPDEYFKRIGAKKENDAIKEKEKADSIERGKKVAEKVATPKVVENTTVNVATPVTKTKPTEKVENNTNTVKAETPSTTTEKPKTISESAKSLYDTASIDYQSGSNSYKEIAQGNAKNVADKNTKDNVSRLTKYLGGGLVGGIADTIGIYGDMVSTAKHNLAQAYFQAAGKGGQYKDPLAKEILSKKIGTMIDSVASAIKENNTVQTERGMDILKNMDEGDKAILGEDIKKVQKWAGMATSEEMAGVQTAFIHDIVNNPKFKDPTYRNAVLGALNDQNDIMLLTTSYKSNPDLFEKYIMADSKAKMARSTKDVNEAYISSETMQNTINAINSDNKLKAIYNGLKTDKQKEMFAAEFAQVLDGARIMKANANMTETDDWVKSKTKYNSVLRPYADTVTGTVKNIVEIVK